MRTNILQNLSAQRYREYLKMLPDLREKKMRDYTMLVLTFFALTFFGLFAINPTLSTITKLNKEISDSEFADKALKQKVDDLAALQQQYTNLQSDLPTLLSSLPDKPDVPKFLAQVQAVVKNSNVKQSDLQALDITISHSTLNGSKTQSFGFTVTVLGATQSLRKFLTGLTSMNRIVTVDTISFSKNEGLDNALSMTIQGKVYYK